MANRIFGPVPGQHPVASLAVVVLMLAASFALTRLLGGSHVVVPHWYYLPILYAGLRFGVAASVPVALISTVLAGPLLPGDAAAGIAQEPSKWLTRGGFFVVVAVALPAMVRLGIGTIRETSNAKDREEAMRTALTRGEIVLHFQPIVNLSTGAPEGAEALVRWQHPTRGTLGPAEFLEDLIQVEEYVPWLLREAMSTATLWRATTGLGHLRIAVNLAAAEVTRPDLLDELRAATVVTGTPPSLVTLEVTESDVIDDIDAMAERLRELRTVGFRVAIDDFGTGHSTLTYVHALPVDEVKVDQSFTRGVGESRHSDVVVSTVVRLAKDLGTSCVAEGVETSAHRDALLAAGCTTGQGYLFSRPMPREQLIGGRYAPAADMSQRGSVAAGPAERGGSRDDSQRAPSLPVRPAASDGQPRFAEQGADTLGGR